MAFATKKMRSQASPFTESIDTTPDISPPISPRSIRGRKSLPVISGNHLMLDPLPQKRRASQKVDFTFFHRDFVHPKIVRADHDIRLPIFRQKRSFTPHKVPRIKLGNKREVAVNLLLDSPNMFM